MMALSWRAAAFVLAAAATVTVSAQSYPVRPVRWIVPFSPGGGGDNLARTMQAAFTDALGQSVVIDNRGGGGGTIGTETAARAAPDGYTLLQVTTGHTVNVTLVAKLPYDVLRDFAPVSLVATQSNVLVVHPAVPVRSLQELVVYARERPRALSFASGGNGSSPHLAGELLKLMAHIDAIHVPYKGSGPAIADLLGGHVQMMFVGPISIEAFVKSGRLRALAVARARRLAILPDVPTMAEVGFPSSETGTWYAVVAPAGTPPAIVARVHEALLRTLANTEVKVRLAAQGVDIVGGTPVQLGTFMRSEVARWGKVVREARLRVD